MAAALPALAGADLLIIDDPRPRERPYVKVATEVEATPARMLSLLGDPETYRRAIPALQRTNAAQPAPGGRRSIEWELEIPLWNLEGNIELGPRPDGVDLELLTGDLAPGLFKLSVSATPRGTFLSVEARANVREANWLTRRLAGRSPLAEPAMLACAAHVLLRSLKLEGERVGAGANPRRQPASAMTPQPLERLDGARLARIAEGSWSANATVAAVHSRRDGRLEVVEVARMLAHPPPRVLATLARPKAWRALPGWRWVGVVSNPGPGAAAGANVPGPDGQSAIAIWKVDASFPFVDLDAVWRVRAGPPFRAVAIEGDAAGAVLGWDVRAAGESGEDDEGQAEPSAAPPRRPARRSVVVFSFHPRIDKLGYFPRKFVEAEPLLEHGLSLGLAYVDAMSLIRTLDH